ncbi:MULTISPECIES: hypothetical protein [unclassified Stappia]|uniref:hypothetical protein n=1 Tax=unclassified Stappia TaxID=2629676 RepID=UPI0016465025|nr:MULTISPECIES: hypothetical protein [unclassified Stappia]
MKSDIRQPTESTFTDPDKEIRAWKAFFSYAAQDVDGASPELLVACAHRLLEMSREPRAPRRGGRRRGPQAQVADAALG